MKTGRTEDWRLPPAKGQGEGREVREIMKRHFFALGLRQIENDDGMISQQDENQNTSACFRPKYT